MLDMRGVLSSIILTVLNQNTGEGVCGRVTMGLQCSQLGTELSFLKGLGKHSQENSFPHIQEAFSPSKLFTVTTQKEREISMCNTSKPWPSYLQVSH